MTDIPTSIKHIKFPFQFGTNGHAMELEQDTDDEIENCVELICSVTLGGLIDQIDFGITDVTFQTEPNAALIQHQIEQWEPRAKVDVNFVQSGDGSDTHMQINVKTGGQNG